MKNICFLFIITCVSLTMQAQIDKDEFLYLKSQIPEENVSLQTNSNHFVNGEKILYKTQVFNTKSNALSDLSKYVYVSLIGADKTIYFEQKLKTNNGQANGDFFIPSSLKTGHYKLISYTNWSKNNATNSFTAKDIIIINPYNTGAKKTTKDQIDIKKSNPLTIAKIENSNFTLTTNKQQFKTREKVEFKIHNSINQLSNVSISITKVDSLKIENITDSNAIPNTQRETYFVPELRGQIISGSIKTKNNSPIANKTVTMSIPGEDYILKNAITNKNGVFFINLDASYHREDAIFQIQEENPENYILTIHTNEFPKNIINQLEFKSLNLDPNIKNWLEQKSINNQIENAFYKEKLDQVSNPILNELFYHPYAKTYNLDDFNRFKTVKETFIEIIYASSITNDGDNYKFSVHDYDNPNIQNTIVSDPLVLVDGILITNNNDIVNYSSYKIDKIAVVVGLYVYGSKVYNGVISFKTKNNDFNWNDIDLKGDFITQSTIKKIEKKKIYTNPNYEENATLLERIPDYRNQLLWLPNKNLNQGENTVQFFTSDNLGTYEIKIEGVSKNGKKVKINTYFTVN